MKKTLKSKLWIFMIVLIVCITGLMFLFKSVNLTASKSEENQLKFDHKKWVNASTDGQDNIRHFMLTDLERNYLKKGMDSIKVKQLLGEPERRFGFSYDLGFYESGFDHTFLIIEFNKKGNINKIDIKTI